MITGSASRFAVLPDDDETDWVPPKSKTKKPAQQAQNAGPTKPKNKAKQKEREEKKELQSLAFGVGNAKSKNKKKSKSNANDHQSVDNKESVPDEEWQSHYKEMIKQENERQLREGIEQSMLDYQGTEEPRRHQVQQKKNRTYTLEQFQNLAKSEQLTNEHGDGRTENFFEQIDHDADLALERETAKAQRREIMMKREIERLQECHETPPPVNNISPLLQQKDDEIDRLKRDIENLETELKLVEESNRQLMSLMQEEHDSVAMAKQLTELKKENEDLGEEVSALTIALEQERSKTHDLSIKLREQQGGRKSSSKH